MRHPLHNRLIYPLLFMLPYWGMSQSVETTAFCTCFTDNLHYPVYNQAGIRFLMDSCAMVSTNQYLKQGSALRKDADLLTLYKQSVNSLGDSYPEIFEKMNRFMGKKIEEPEPVTVVLSAPPRGTEGVPPPPPPPLPPPPPPAPPRIFFRAHIYVVKDSDKKPTLLLTFVDKKEDGGFLYPEYPVYFQRKKVGMTNQPFSITLVPDKDDSKEVLETTDCEPPCGAKEILVIHTPNSVELTIKSRDEDFKISLDLPSWQERLKK